MSGVTTPEPKKRTGLLESAMLKLFTRKVRVVDLENVGTAFRIVTLRGDSFGSIEWTPGDKIQILLGGWVQRTYTPMEWDGASGRTRILIYLHSGGPGVQWARTLQIGDEYDAFGPRASLTGGDASEMSIVFGDETSIGLAHALSRRSPGNSTRCLLEVTSIANAREALARLDLGGVELFERVENDAHIEEIQQRLSVLTTVAATFVLTGKANSIQRLRRALKMFGVPTSKILAKPYWAPGKAGLD